MMSLKGNCLKCKGVITVFDPGMACYDCEKVTHGKCLTPQLDAKEMEALSIRIRWICPACQAIRGQQFEEDTRTTVESKEIKKKLKMIDDIRMLLVEIEKALDDMENKCDDLTEKAKKLQLENLKLRIRLVTHKNKDREMPPLIVQPVKRKKKIMERLERRSISKQAPAVPTEEVATKKKKRFWKSSQKTEKPHWKKGTLSHPEEMGHFFKDLRGYAFRHGLDCGEKAVLWLLGSQSHSKRWLLLLSLLIVVILYTVLGAVLFSNIEGYHEQELIELVFENRRVFIQTVVEAGDKKAITEQLEKYYDFMAEQFGKNGKLLQHGDDFLNWSFFNSIYFCGTTYTTIGYGDIVPVTFAGKMAMIIYALVGIPLYLILLAVMGSRLSICIKYTLFLFTRLGRCFAPRKRRRSIIIFDANDDNFNLSVWGAIILEIVYLLIGAYIFTYGENWTFFESFYFVFISMLTIGFGDYVESNIDYMMAAFAYIMVGLAITSMVITIIRNKIVASFEKATEKLGTTIEQYIEEQYLADPEHEDIE